MADGSPASKCVSDRPGAGHGPASGRRRKALLWLGLCLSVPGAAYASLGVVYFAWLAGLQQASESAGVFAVGALVLALVCAGTFVGCLVALVRDARRAGAARRGAA